MYPPFASVQVDERHLVLRIQAAGCGEEGPEYVLMAPSEKVLIAVFDRLQSYHLHNNNKRNIVQNGATESATIQMTANELHAEAIQAEQEARPSLIDFPRGAALTVVLIHIVLFPMKILLHCTIPDVRSATNVQKTLTHGPSTSTTTSLVTKDDSSTPFYCQASTWVLPWALIASTFWLVVSSLVMIISLEKVGAILLIHDDIVGITISAVGTSIPIYIASAVAAKQGLGNMAVGNAISSSTFNILVGLGLPWFLYTTFVSDTYHDLSNEGMDEALAWMIGSLVVVIVLVVTGGFLLCRWHAVVLVLIYVAYLGLTIAGSLRTTRY